jgi:hypothetical protein
VIGIRLIPVVEVSRFLVEVGGHTKTQIVVFDHLLFLKALLVL